jgi:hypothetical protein
MEDDLNFFLNGRPQIFENGRRPQKKHAIKNN